jgi:hypothetical protein
MIHITSFVRRQTADSRFSHWTLDDNALVQRIEAGLPNAKPGYREGVVLVPVETDGFYSATVTMTNGQKLVGEFASRRPGEEPRKSLAAIGQKQPAGTVWVVLYAHHVLIEKNENESDANWEVVSINASPSVDAEPAPMPPETLIANHFELDGGTATKMSDSEFVASLKASVLYWKDKAQVQPE